MLDMTDFRYRPVTSKLDITLLVGNGFDIRMLNRFRRPATTFSAFLDYERMVLNRKIDDDPILAHLSKGLAAKRDQDTVSTEPPAPDDPIHWADVEAAILACIQEVEDQVAPNDDAQREQLVDLLNRVEMLRADFSDYLGEIVTAPLLRSINHWANQRPDNQEDLTSAVLNQSRGGGVRAPKDASSNLNTLRCFNRDLRTLAPEAYAHFRFDSLANYYDIMAVTVFNFNYTTLLDNYLAMTKANFDPHIFPQAPTNFVYQVPAQTKGGHWKTYHDYLITTVIHPHGLAAVPSSMMFGIDNIDQLNRHVALSEIDRHAGLAGIEQLFAKPYLVQDELNYRQQLQATELFVAFGLSFGRSDDWWWRQVLLRMSQTISPEALIPPYGDSIHRDKQRHKPAYQPELIIYHYAPEASSELLALEGVYSRLQAQLDAETAQLVAQRRLLADKGGDVDAIDARLAQADQLTLLPFEVLAQRIYIIPFDDDTPLNCFDLPRS
ncbi:AbiH family protein [Lacticaseibacillus absianus]|uniref:AbiH family protein n=1 Tax=Lacticaseibacillus absianus TaxID=2729623 RepID=UPI0015C7D662|nr:AbiH family protein [Lacticaseibacillus absianus]